MGLLTLVSPLTKALATATLILVLTNSVMVWAYLGIRDELTSLKSTHMQLEQVFKECSEGKKRNQESFKQDDKLIVSNIAQLNTIKSETDRRVSELKSIPNKACAPVNKITDGVKNEIPEYVDIDQPFSPDFIKLFEQPNTNKGDTNTTPR